jgi:hypothetical protein
MNFRRVEEAVEDDGDAKNPDEDLLPEETWTTSSALPLLQKGAESHVVSAPAVARAGSLHHARDHRSSHLAIQILGTLNESAIGSAKCRTASARNSAAGKSTLR